MKMLLLYECSKCEATDEMDVREFPHPIEEVENTVQQCQEITNPRKLEEPSCGAKMWLRGFMPQKTFDWMVENGRNPYRFGHQDAEILAELEAEVGVEAVPKVIR